MKMHQKKIRRMLFIMLFEVALIPASHFIKSNEQTKLDELHVNLRQERIHLTRMQQDVHYLESFAERLQEDKTLHALVTQDANEGGLWQTPIARTRLAVQDSVSQLNTNFGDTNAMPAALSIDWLDKSHSNGPRSEDVRRLWLSANVTSVQEGISLLKVLSETVYPYPMSVRGCGYRRESSADWVNGVRGELELRCLLTLSAWKLPLLRFSELDNPTESTESTESSESSEVGRSGKLLHASIPGARIDLGESLNRVSTNSETQWTLFHSVSEDEIADEPDTVVRVGIVAIAEEAPSPPAQAKRILSKGVFTGPAGTSVIHVR